MNNVQTTHAFATRRLFFTTARPRYPNNHVFSFMETGSLLVVCRRFVDCSCSCFVYRPRRICDNPVMIFKNKNNPIISPQLGALFIFCQSVIAPSQWGAFIFFASWSTSSLGNRELSLFYQLVVPQAPLAMGSSVFFASRPASSLAIA